MIKAIIGRKAGMTQVFTADGKVIPVTVIEAGPCPVVQIKTVEKEVYAALKLGFDKSSEKALTKPQLGQFKKAGVEPCKVLKEFRLSDLSSYAVGNEVKVDVFSAGDKVDVHGVTKGHGYSGVIKRWNQHRLKETHGVRKRTASALSTGSPVPWARTARLRGYSRTSVLQVSTVTKT